MRLHVKLLGFSIWLLFLHCARCKECLREDIKYENTEPVEKASYTDDETVRVRCMTGYTGLYKLKCEKGRWKNLIERQCAKYKCSHPGDTPNGDFKLTEGTEFVFGVTVVYTCRTGYEMVSRINQRTCRAQGWDNAVPLCEVVKCPGVRTDGDVTASGNTEEGSYGEVIHFECVSSDKMIAGSSDIYCTETGKWSDSVPKCIDITCTAPDIPNGLVVEGMPEYQKDAILEYRCDPGFKKREGIPKCTKFGWTIKPECDEVTCELKSTTFGVKKINPDGKTIFRAGESVEITCSERHWLFMTKETSKSFTCQYNGQWDSEPVCQEITCEVPRDQHVSYLYYYFRGDMKLGTKKQYKCESGYDTMAAEATCTKDGWTPNPLCEKMCTAPNIPDAEIVEGKSVTSKYQIYSKIKYQCHPGFEPEKPIEITCNSRAQWTDIQKCTEKMCAAPNIPNAEIVGDSKSKYQINLRIQYKCLPGFEPEQPVQITCDSQGQWTGIQQCTELCPDPSVKNGFIYKQPSNKTKIFYSCNTGYKPFSGKWWDSVTCSKGSWSDEPHCIQEEECGALPSVHHGKLQQTKHTFRNGDTTEFECDPGFISTPRFMKCINGAWEKPVCKEDVRCDIPPKVENAVITSKPEEFYVDGSSVTYVCQNPFSISGESMVFCRGGTWEETPMCQGTVQCSKPSKNLQFVTLSDEKTEYSNSETLTYTCKKPYNEIPGGVLMCQNGNWNGTFDCKSKICPPPQYLENGDFDTVSTKDNVITAVSYTCQPYYVLTKQQDVYKCVDGKWETPPKCLRPCEIDDIVEKYNLQPPTGKVFIKHGGKYRLNCKVGWNPGRRMKAHVDVSCSNGNLQIDKSCDTQNQ